MNIDKRRRILLQGTAGVGALAAAGLLAPRELLAAWPKEAFSADTLDTAIDARYGGAASPSDAIDITAPEIAENGRVVPISVETTLADPESISIFVANNPSPLAASFVLGPGARGYAAMRVKMGETSDVVAVVKAGGKLHSAKQEVKVTIGGCGG